MKTITFVDLCNTLADIKSELEELGVDASVYPSNVPESVWTEGSIFERSGQNEEVVGFVKDLADSTELVYLTARPLGAAKASMEWLKRYDLPEAPLIFTGGIPKGQMIYNQILGKDYDEVNVIEDAPSEIESIRAIVDKLPIPINFYIPDQPYNKEYPGTRLNTR